MHSSCLVTGAAGFLGSHVAELLLARGCRVVGLDDLSGGYRENVVPGVEFVEGSILDVALVERLFATHRFTHVYHLAAYAAEGLSHFIRRYNYTNNVVGSMNLINASIRAGTVQCFVFTSSIAVYGAGQIPFTEATQPHPEDPYGVAKYTVELDLAAARAQFGLNSVVFRPHNVYGERQNVNDPYRNVVGIFFRQALQDQPLTIFGDGQQTRAFSHHSEVCPIIAEAGFRPLAYNRTFNLGAATPFSVLQLAQGIGQSLGKAVWIQHLPARNEVKHAVSDHGRVQQFFGDLIKPLPLAEGLQRTADWVRGVPFAPVKRFAEIEIEQGLPESWSRLR